MQIIGQQTLIEEVNSLVTARRGLPRFIVLTGEDGSGKKTMGNYIAEKSGYPITFVGNKIDDIRAVIDAAYRVQDPIIYFIDNGDELSVGAKNSLLKITEEPPRRAYFILAVTSPENTLATLLSRGVRLNIQPYTEADIARFIALSGKQLDALEISIVQKACRNGGQVKKLLQLEKVTHLLEFVQETIKVILGEGAEALSFSKLLKLKEDDEKGYDPALFFNLISGIWLEKMYNRVSGDGGELDREELETLKKMLYATSKASLDLQAKGLNKQAVIDSWVLEVRKVCL